MTLYTFAGHALLPGIHQRLRRHAPTSSLPVTWRRTPVIEWLLFPSSLVSLSSSRPVNISSVFSSAMPSAMSFLRGQSCMRRCVGEGGWRDFPVPGSCRLQLPVYWSSSFTDNQGIQSLCEFYLPDYVSSCPARERNRRRRPATTRRRRSSDCVASVPAAAAAAHKRV